MKRFLMVVGLALVAGSLLASTALAAAPGPGRSLGMGSWMRSRTGHMQLAAPTPAPGSETPAPRDPSAGSWMGGMMGGGMMNGMMNGLMGGMTMMHDDLEKLLGLSHAEIHDQMVAGKSLVEMAAAKGVSKDQLTKALLDGRRVALDQAVKDGRLTQEQATTMLQYMEKNIETMVTTQGMGGMMGGMMGGVTPGPDGQALPGSCHSQTGQPSQSSGQTGGAGGAGEPQNGLQQA